MKERIRVLLAKAGLDGHDRGVKVVLRVLRDAGMEVIYTGLYQTPEVIVRAAIQEDADVIGVSILSGAHLTVFSEIMSLLRENGAEDIAVVGGGIVPAGDIAKLEEMGVKKIFLPGAGMYEIAKFIESLRSGADASEA